MAEDLRMELLRQADRLAYELGGATLAELNVAVGAGHTVGAKVQRAVEKLMQAGDLIVIDYKAGEPRYVLGQGGNS
jgi:hypothetical protein